MVAASPNFRGELKISDQNNWGAGAKILGEGTMNLNDAMTVVLKDILLFFRF